MRSIEPKKLFLGAVALSIALFGVPFLVFFLKIVSSLFRSNYSERSSYLDHGFYSDIIWLVLFAVLVVAFPIAVHLRSERKSQKERTTKLGTWLLVVGLSIFCIAALTIIGLGLKKMITEFAKTPPETIMQITDIVIADTGLAIEFEGGTSFVIREADWPVSKWWKSGDKCRFEQCRLEDRGSVTFLSCRIAHLADGTQVVGLHVIENELDKIAWEVLTKREK